MMNKEERIAKLREFNDKCRIKQLLESNEDKSLHETVIINYNGKLIDVPKWVDENQ